MAELAPNTKLSHYRIVSRIGAGGMGEVYLAEDTQLERQVALKVLLAEVANDEDRVRRFVQEAKEQIVALKFLPDAIALDGGALARFHNEVRITCSLPNWRFFF